MADIRDMIRHRALAFARFARTSILPAVVAALIMLVGGYVFQQQNSTNFRNDLKSEVASTLSLTSAQLKGNIHRSMTALSGIANGVAVEPHMRRERFEALAAKTMSQNPGIVRISLAPAGVVTMAVPDGEGRRVEGRHLDRFVSSRTATQRAKVQGRPVMAGSLKLPDGRSGFDLYIPIFVGQSRAPMFWGYVEAVISDTAVYQTAGLAKDVTGERQTQKGTGPSHTEIAIRDVSVPGNLGEAFFGRSEVFEMAPVLQTLTLPGGVWQLAGLPVEGWDVKPDNQDRLQFFTFLAAIAVVIPIAFTSGLVGERQRTLAALNRRNEEFLAMSHRLNLALDCSRFGIWEIDLETSAREWDERMYDLHGLPPGSGPPDTDTCRDCLHPDDVVPTRRALAEAIEHLQPYRADYRVVLPDEIRHVRNAGSVITGSDGNRKITGVSWDITDDVRLTRQLMEAKALAEAHSDELAAAKDRIEHNALHDPLTGLGNRRKLDRVLFDLLDAGRERHCTVALLHMDLDRFKQINDTLGHGAGDAMLVHASQVLTAHTGPDDVVARIGGDEFVIVVRNPTEPALEAMSKRIIQTMRQPVDHYGFACRFGVSIGIAVSSDTTIDARRLLVNADIALYRAKENGRNRYEFFNETLQAEIVNNKRLSDEILEAIEKDQFTAWYQPQVDAETLQLCGVEALIRWNHPTRGVLTPDAFLAIAEDLNVVATLDRIVLERALIDMMRWTAAGITVPTISVNVSVRRLRDEGLLASLEGLSFQPGRLCFELVEAIFLDGDDEIITANIAGLKAMGIDIELDDFGTGHTSVVSLLKIKPKRLKIDRQLVSPIIERADEQALVKAIIEIGRSLGIGIVAEGVETGAHAKMLRLFGCDILQGYAFARPLPADDFAAYAARPLPLAS